MFFSESILCSKYMCVGVCFSPGNLETTRVLIQALGRYIEDHTGQKFEECFHDTWDPGAIEQLIADQKKVNSYLKKHKAERLLSIHITIDDFGENMNVVKSNHSILNTLFVKGRHYQISSALLLQRFRLASPTIRYNAHALYVHKLSNMADLKALAEEFAACTVSTLYSEHTVQ